MTTDTSTTETGTTERAQQAASAAADEGRRVAAVAAGEVQSVAAEAGQQVRSVVGDAMGQAKGQLDDQSRQQKERLAGTLATFGDDLGRMSEHGSGLAAGVAAEVADRARSLSRQLDQREPSEILDDVRRFARQRPGTFLLGALAAGVVVGRLLRGTKDAVEAAEAEESPGVTPRITTGVTPGAPDPGSVSEGLSGPTQEPSFDTPPTATGYPSPLRSGLSSGPDAPGGATT